MSIILAAEASGEHRRLVLRELRDFVQRATEAGLSDETEFDVTTKGFQRLRKITTAQPASRGF